MLSTSPTKRAMGVKGASTPRVIRVFSYQPGGVAPPAGQRVRSTLFVGNG